MFRMTLGTFGDSGSFRGHRKEWCRVPLIWMIESRWILMTGICLIWMIAILMWSVERVWSAECVEWSVRSAELGVGGARRSAKCGKRGVCSVGSGAFVECAVRVLC